ncbi:MULTISPECIES: CPBP family intramembrane glutamic endopeptidase [Asticcacaulis]|uniref:CPBP family intramembrane glutamic endopeptidase n=1 Tax=Asticcacaulis TaxID=76890 RepID=UPI001AEADCB5|nr:MULTISPECIES: CPBP family intramembrane glutamic endopeptidase [Asticcacaulis]MBP2157473.1 membrane protease YdiL (CAAX protease family) [Asticcacaulis solisilvae]MDR6798518.1 membrane protease YdiL (CAAX protease family) [Asticcacaulis sp. BE141]
MTTRMGSAGARLVAGVQIITAIAAMFTASGLIGTFVTPLVPEYLRTPVLALALWGGVIAGGLMLGLSKRGYNQIGFSAPHWSRCLLWTVLAVVICQGGALLIGVAIKSLTDWPPLDVSYIRTSIAGNPAAYAAWIVLVVWGSAAFGEELLARGFIMNRLQSVFGQGLAGTALAIAGQAAIFGALHAIQGPTGVIITAYVGIVLAVAYYASGRNLWAPILAHGIMDSLSLTAMFLGLPLPGYIT